MGNPQCWQCVKTLDARWRPRRPRPALRWGQAGGDQITHGRPAPTKCFLQIKSTPPGAPKSCSGWAMRCHARARGPWQPCRQVQAGTRAALAAQG